MSSTFTSAPTLTPPAAPTSTDTGKSFTKRLTKTKTETNNINPNALNVALQQAEYILLGFGSDPAKGINVVSVPVSVPVSKTPTSSNSTIKLPQSRPTPTELEASIARTRAAHFMCMKDLQRAERRYKDVVHGTKVSRRRCKELKQTIEQLEQEIALEKQHRYKNMCQQHDILIPRVNQPAFQNDSDALRQAINERSIDVNGKTFDMNSSSELDQLVALAKEDPNVLKLIERRMKARQRRYLADTLSYTNATAYRRGESLYQHAFT